MRAAAGTLRLPGPVRVAVVDLANPLGDLDCARSASPPYASAWILACRSGYPLGSIELPLSGTVITAAELEGALRGQLGGAFSGTHAGAVPAGTDAVPLARVSIVVPSNFARPGQLRRCVKQLTALDHPGYEVIVVDNRRGNPAPADIPGARVVREPHPGISAARNRGVAAATGEIIAFTDDDVVADRRWLRALGERFARQPDLAAVTGMVVPLELETPAQVLMAGHKLGYEPGAVIHHSHRATLAELDHQIYGYGLGFTAMLTAVTMRDPRHLIGLASVLPSWLRSLRDPSSAKRVNRAVGYPPALARAELRGMLAGPYAYLRSRRTQRRWAG
jgi:hypothetical protein